MLKNAEEVEEQLRLLQEIIPDWISEKTALGRDVLIRLAYKLIATLCLYFLNWP